MIEPDILTGVVTSFIHIKDKGFHMQLQLIGCCVRILFSEADFNHYHFVLATPLVSNNARVKRILRQSI